MAVKTTFSSKDVLPDIDSWLLPRENGMMLSDYQIGVLKRNNIDYNKYKNTKEMLFAINELDIDDDEMEEVAKEIEERDYYSRLVN